MSTVTSNRKNSKKRKNQGPKNPRKAKKQKYIPTAKERWNRYLLTKTMAAFKTGTSAWIKKRDIRESPDTTVAAFGQDFCTADGMVKDPRNQGNTNASTLMCLETPMRQNILKVEKTMRQNILKVEYLQAITRGEVQGVHDFGSQSSVKLEPSLKPLSPPALNRAMVIDCTFNATIQKDMTLVMIFELGCLELGGKVREPQKPHRKGCIGGQTCELSRFFKLQDFHMCCF